MSSEARSEELEQILAARYELLCCRDEEKEACNAHLMRLVDRAIASHPTLSRMDLMEAIKEPFREYRIARDRALGRRIGL